MFRKVSVLVCVCCCWVGLVGCADQNKKMDMGAMKAPARPAELDLLNPWVGKWESTGEMKMPDGTTMTSTGTSELKWELDNRVLVEHATGTMPEMGTHHMMIVFTYDAKDKEYEAAFFDSMGGEGDSDMWYDSKTRTWHLKGEPMYDPMVGKDTIFNMSITMPDNNTMKFNWTQHEAFLGMKGKKICEGSGTARRAA